MGRIIRLSYDIVSPWSYLAYSVLKRYRSIWNFKLELYPVWIGGVMAASKNTSPVYVPNKEKKMREEIPLMANFFGVQCIIPQKFPFNTLPVMRFLKVVELKDPGQLENLTNKFYEAIFENKIQVENLDSIFQMITPEPYTEEKIEEYLKFSRTDEIKDTVKNDANQLSQQGAFGFPWIDVFDSHGNHLSIFGSDRFEFLAYWLGEEWKGPNPQFQPQKSNL